MTDTVELGDEVRIVREDPNRGGHDGIVTHIDRREGRRYLGLDIKRPYRVGHTVWRYEEDLVVITKASAVRK